jgi:hypothetical protein
MKKILIVITALFCINNGAWSQNELKFFKSDNAFYLGNRRLLDNEIRQTLSKNAFALNSWERGNRMRNVNLGMKVATGILIPVGSIVLIVGCIEAVAMMSATMALLPLYVLSATSPSPSTEDESGVSGLLTAGGILLTAGIITGIMIPITKGQYKSYYADAVNIYNSGLSKTALSLHIGTTGNGFGVSLKF